MCIFLGDKIRHLVTVIYGRKTMEIIINNIVYYNLDDIRGSYPNIFTNNKLTSRKMILTLDINQDDYLYAYIKKNEWIISTELYCKAKVLIKKKWLDSKVGTTSQKLLSEIANVPKLVINGRELNIEIRTIGPISMDNILFRVKDIALEFDMPKLRDSITDKRTAYEENVDYKKINTGGSTPYIYLTYMGLLRFIFVSRGSKVAAEIQKWIMDIIYKCQFGNQEQKVSLIKTVVPNYSDIVCDIFNKFEFSCLYLIGIGNYGDCTNVYKFGRTNDFNRRYKEHAKTYNTIPTVCILQHIDTDYLPKAEVDVKQYMIDINALLSIDAHDELVSLTDKQVKSVMTIYKHIGHTYSAKTDILQGQITSITHQMELLTKDNEIKLLKEQQKLLEKENIILQLEKELLKIKSISNK